MFNQKLIFSVILLLTVIRINISAQVSPATEATGHILAEIIPVFSASETSKMNFGKFSPGPQGGRIIVTPENTISVQGNVFTTNSGHNAASFYVTGDVDTFYSVSLPTSPVILTHTSVNKTLEVAEWVAEPSPAIAGSVLEGGFQVVYVGATLKIGPLTENPVGLYTGSYTITFDFN